MGIGLLSVRNQHYEYAAILAITSMRNTSGHVKGVESELTTVGKLGGCKNGRATAGPSSSKANGRTKVNAHPGSITVHWRNRRKRCRILAIFSVSNDSMDNATRADKN